MHCWVVVGADDYQLTIRTLLPAYDAAGAAIYLVNECDQRAVTKITARLLYNNNRFRTIQFQQLVTQFAVTDLPP